MSSEYRQDVDLPEPLPGWVCFQFVKVRGRKRGPYPYRFFYQGGRLRKAYVRKADLERVLIATRLWSLERHALRELKRMAKESTSISRLNHTRIREIAQTLGGPQ